jgi:hypothetical protein
MSCGHSLVAVAVLLSAAACSLPSGARESDAPGLMGVCDLARRCIVFQEAEGGEYVCRAPANHCEAAFIDRGCSQQACEAEAGCVFDPGRCFCPSGVQCVCGGGPPPGCRPIARGP